VEFSEKVFGLQKNLIEETPAYKQHRDLPQKEADELLLAKILAFAPTTWANYTNPLKEYTKFCTDRSVNPLESGPQTLNLFLISTAQKGKTLSSMEKLCTSIGFTLRFFMVPDFTQHDAVQPVKKFLSKVCPRKANLKAPFGSVEVRKLWDHMERKYPGLSWIPLVELRTFVLAVTQYSTFCRFADLAVVNLSDVVHELDFFKIVVQYSKTDQTGQGQDVFILKTADRYRNPHMLMCLYLQCLDSYDVQDLYLFPPVV
jgi:site-specific recombinase XerD